MAIETMEIQERYTKKAVRCPEAGGLRHYVLKPWERSSRPCWGRSRTIESNGSNGGLAGKRAGDGKQTWNATSAFGKDTSRGTARQIKPKEAPETGSRRRHNRSGGPNRVGRRKRR